MTPTPITTITSGVFSAPLLVTLPLSVTQIPALREVPRESLSGSQGHLCNRDRPTLETFSRVSQEPQLQGLFPGPRQEDRGLDW